MPYVPWGILYPSISGDLRTLHTLRPLHLLHSCRSPYELTLARTQAPETGARVDPPLPLMLNNNY